MNRLSVSPFPQTESLFTGYQVGINFRITNSLMGPVGYAWPGLTVILTVICWDVLRSPRDWQPGRNIQYFQIYNSQVCVHNQGWSWFLLPAPFGLFSFQTNVVQWDRCSTSTKRFCSAETFILRQCLRASESGAGYIINVTDERRLDLKAWYVN